MHQQLCFDCNDDSVDVEMMWGEVGWAVLSGLRTGMHHLRTGMHHLRVATAMNDISQHHANRRRELAVCYV